MGAHYYNHSTCVSKQLGFMGNNGMARIILFIEDEKNFQEILGKLLMREGYKILRAYDGDEGLRRAEADQPNMILLDLVLPKKDGFEVLSELKKNKKTSEIPVLVLTNLESTENIQRVLDMGAAAYLVKANYQPDEVVSKINGVFENQ